MKKYFALLLSFVLAFGLTACHQDEKQDFYNDIERIKPKYREVDLGFFYKKTMY